VVMVRAVPHAVRARPPAVAVRRMRIARVALRTRDRARRVLDATVRRSALRSPFVSSERELRPHDI
jgi:hypothetical protein